MKSTNELRVFISSTFRDLQEEREHLIKKIFPEIRSLCRERGITFTEVDLRWGITEEEAERDGIIRICLEEIDRCRPYFIGILGERYGWMPSSDETNHVGDEFPSIVASIAAGASITEMEIIHGVLANPAMAGHAWFYFRDREVTPDEFVDTNAETASRLSDLKERIRDSGFPVRENYRSPAELGSLIDEDLREVIDRQYPEREAPSALELERRAHGAFASSRRRGYVANPEYLKQFNDFVDCGLEDVSIQNCLAVSGASGLGKSSLVAYVVEDYRSTHPTAFVIEHYVGVSQASGSAPSVMRHIVEEIRERFAISDEIPSQHEELEKSFPNWLFRAEHFSKELGIPIMIAIDAVNQLNETEQQLGWLPKTIPSAIHLIVSTTPGIPAARLAERSWQFLEVQRIEDELVRTQIVRRYLGEFRKGINDKQMHRLTSDAKATSPLYLRVVAEELRLHGEHETLDLVIDRYAGAADLPALFDRVLKRIEEDYGEALVEDVMRGIWGSRSGLSETELIEIMGVSRLELSRLLFAVDYHFIQREGLLGFSHAYFHQAVESRYINDLVRTAIHHRLGTYYDERTTESLEPSGRDVRERAYQWYHANNSQRLVETLLPVRFFAALWKGDGQYDVLRYWALLRQQGYDPGPLYLKSLEPYEATEPDVRAVLNVFSQVGNLLERLRDWNDALTLLGRRRDIAAAAMLPDEVALAEGAFGTLLVNRGENNEALGHLADALTLFQELGDAVSVARVNGNIGMIHAGRGEHKRALAYFEQTLAVCQEHGDRSGVATAFGSMASMYTNLGDYDRALEFYRRAIEIWQDLGDIHGIAVNIGNIAGVHAKRGEYELALEQFESWRIICHDLGNRNHAVQALRHKGFMYYNLRQHDDALTCYEEALSGAHELGDRTNIAGIIENIGHVHLARGEYDRAINCYQQGIAIYEEVGEDGNVAIATGNIGFVFMERRLYDSALESFETALAKHREAGFLYGVTYWLVGRATVLLECTQRGGACPEFLLTYIGDSNPDIWRSVLQTRVRQDAQECLELSHRISKPDTIFGSQIILARIEAVEGNLDAAVRSLKQLLIATVDEAERADAHYWIWKLHTIDSEDHRDDALLLYRELYRKTLTQAYRERIDELSASTEPTTSESTDATE